MRRGVMWWLLLLIILQPISLPVAASSWEEDGWLSTGYADERFNAGDEFGCSGIPGLSWEADPGAVALECMSYLTERVEASSWGANPLSVQVPESLNWQDHSRIDGQGFPVHGDLGDLSSTAWHDAEDAPMQASDWYNIGRRGGSLEKGVSDLEAVKSEAEMGGLLNFYWVGRADETTIRHDADLIQWLEESDAWFTTWGVAWSMWAIQRCNNFAYQTRTTDSSEPWSFTVERGPSCLAQESRIWDVPVSWRISSNGSGVSDIVLAETGESLAVIDVSDNQLKSGWRMDGGDIILSTRIGEGVLIHFNKSGEEIDIQDIQWFNNRSFAVTVASHDTEDLFTWSKRFDASSDIRFTWLLTPRDARSSSPWLPVIGVAVVLGSMLAYSMMIKRDKALLQSRGPSSAEE